MNLGDLIPSSCRLLALGEPTHLEPGFARLRNELFAELAARGFRSIVLETDRVAALLVDDYVRGGAGTLDDVLRDGFSHGLGEVEANRRLVGWMREFNADRATDEQLSFHGFDAPTEMMNAPSPRRFLEHARDFLGLDADIAGPAGDDERWSRTEAVLDAAQSPGDGDDARLLRCLADDMLVTMDARAPQLIAGASLRAWRHARTHLLGGLALLRYHRECARPIENSAVRISHLSEIRDAIMARNLLGIRAEEGQRGPGFLFAHNLHVQRSPSRWRLSDLDLQWHCAGAMLAAWDIPGYAVIAGSLGRSATIGLGTPEPGTYEAFLDGRGGPWSLTAAGDVPDARKRTDTRPEQGYFPVDASLLAGVDAVLHLPG